MENTMLKSLYIVLLVVPMLLFSKDFYVEKTNIKGPHSNLFSAVDVLVNDAVVNTRNSRVVTNSGYAHYTLRPQLLSLGESYIFSLQKIDTKGAIISSTKLKSKNSNELDNVIKRVVREVISGKSASSNIRVGEVIDKDIEKSHKKIEVSKSVFFGFGPSWTQNVNGNDGIEVMLGYLFGLNSHFNLTTDFTYSGVSDSSAYMSSFAIGGKYHITNSQHAPYVGANFGYGWARFGKETDTDNNISSILNFFNATRARGWMLGANAGVTFFRASTVNIGLEAKYRMLLDEFEFNSPTQEDKKPSKVSLNIVLSY